MVRNVNQAFSVIRTIAFGALTLSAVAELALSAAFSSWTLVKYGDYYIFAVLGMVSAGFTMCSLPVLLFLSLKRKGAVLSIVAYEVGWTFFLWGMWVSTSGLTMKFSRHWVPACFHNFHHQFDNLCREIQALNVFCFVSWVILFIYGITLLFLVVRQQRRGNLAVWQGYINSTDFAAASPSLGPPSPSAIEEKGDGSDLPFSTTQHPSIQARSAQIYAQSAQATVPVQGLSWSPYPEV
ncbi:hypothetical protein GALMADRAFT_162017 [Galerina marginata CBS 339.88]|uniref:MARVEL domain-containing protein n=1 Tax=Galerina marginata (strain CBS 339.88) TaxID=685588 RepID=A0A067S9J8_GALM3|nr:hypothetical protein GALMADRAFT_162017 [Galerina marginata CBS 339.88]